MNAYKPLDRTLLATADDQRLFQGIGEHVQTLLGDAWFPHAEVERLDGTPEAVKTAWYLWWFAAEVGGNGFNGYLGNGPATVGEIQTVRRALKDVGATDLLEMLEAGIQLAREYDPPFWEEPAAEAFLSMAPSAKWTSLEDMDETAMDLAAEPLSRLVARHLRENPSGV